MDFEEEKTTIQHLMDKVIHECGRRKEKKLAKLLGSKEGTGCSRCRRRSKNRKKARRRQIPPLRAGESGSLNNVVNLSNVPLTDAEM